MLSHDSAQASNAVGVLTILGIGGSFASEGWIVRQDGIGSAKIGMSLSQLNAALHEKFAKPPNKEDQGCFYVNPTKHPDVSLMIENGHPVRIDVDKAGVSTAEGRASMWAILRNMRSKSMVPGLKSRRISTLTVIT